MTVSPTERTSNFSARDPLDGARNILIVNAVALNGGDAAILKAVVASIDAAFPGAAIAVLDKHADVSQQHYPEFDFYPSAIETCRPGRRTGSSALILTVLRIANLLIGALVFRILGGRRAWFGLSADQWNLLRLYRNASAVVSTGGTMFVEKYKLLPRALDVWLAYLLAKPVVLFTQSFEPVKWPVNRLLMRSVLVPADLVLVRGEESRGVARALGARDSRLVSLPDAVFRFGVGVDAKPSGQPPRILISVRHWEYAAGGAAMQDRYRLQLAEFCERAVKAWGARLLFVSTCQGIPEYNSDDSREADVILSLMSLETKAYVSVNHDFHQPEELMTLLGAADVVVATRLHACILALNACTPTVPISYERKTEEVFGRLLPDILVQRFETVHSGLLLSQVEHELANREDRVKYLSERIEREAKESRLADQLMREYLDGI